MRRCQDRFSRVIFVDDRLHNLEDVEKHLKQFDSSLEYCGIHYTGAKRIASPPISEQAFIDRWSGLITRAKTIDYKEKSATRGLSQR